MERAAVNPVLSIRDEIRRVASLYGELRRQQVRAGNLLGELAELSSKANAILEKVGTDYVVVGTDVEMDGQGLIRERPTEVGRRLASSWTAWSDLLIGLEKLSRQWIAEATWSNVLSLADCLDEVGEVRLAQSIRTEARGAVVFGLQRAIGMGSITPDEIRRIERWLEVRSEDFEARDMVVEAWAGFVESMAQEGDEQGVETGLAGLSVWDRSRAGNMRQGTVGVLMLLAKARRVAETGDYRKALTIAFSVGSVGGHNDPRFLALASDIANRWLDELERAIPGRQGVLASARYLARMSGGFNNSSNQNNFLTWVDQAMQSS